MVKYSDFNSQDLPKVTPNSLRIFPWDLKPTVNQKYSPFKNASVIDGLVTRLCLGAVWGERDARQGGDWGEEENPQSSLLKNTTPIILYSHSPSYLPLKDCIVNIPNFNPQYGQGECKNTWHAVLKWEIPENPFATQSITFPPLGKQTNLFYLEIH